MRGNVGFGGGGGSFVGGYLAAKNPEAAAAGAALAVVLLGVGLGVYFTAVAVDTPGRDPLATQIVENSLQACANAGGNTTLYTKDLKDGLMSMWSGQLKDFVAQEITVCEDAALNNFVLPYNYDQVGTNYRGEYRVMGVLYTKADGSQVLVVKPKTDVRAPNSIDDQPDSPLDMGTVLGSVKDIPAEAYRHTLPDGTAVSVFLQQDGVTQQHGSGRIPDNDGKGWADQGRMGEILQHYSFQWPAAQQVSAALTPQVTLSL